MGTLTGFKIANSWISKATLNASSSYDIGMWPVQSDMGVGRIWRRPGNSADIVRPVAEIVISLDGRASGYGGAEFNFPMLNLTPKMVGYILTTFFASGASFSCDVTVRTFNRENGDWEVYQAVMLRPDPTTDAQPQAGGYSDYMLKFTSGTLL